MPVKVTEHGDQRTTTIKIIGQFDFSVHKEFREAYRYVDVAGAVFNVELSDASYMDSSALGMLLLLKEHAENLEGKIVLCKPNESVNKILKIANFHELMTIEE